MFFSVALHPYTEECFQTVEADTFEKAAVDFVQKMVWLNTRDGENLICAEASYFVVVKDEDGNKKKMYVKPEESSYSAKICFEYKG